MDVRGGLSQYLHWSLFKLSHLLLTEVTRIEPWLCLEVIKLILFWCQKKPTEARKLGTFNKNTVLTKNKRIDLKSHSLADFIDSLGEVNHSI